MTHTYRVGGSPRLAGFRSVVVECVCAVVFAAWFAGLVVSIRVRRLSVALGVRWQRFQGALAGYQHQRFVVPLQLWLACGRPVGFPRPRASFRVWLVRRWLFASGWLSR